MSAQVSVARVLHEGVGDPAQCTNCLGLAAKILAGLEKDGYQVVHPAQAVHSPVTQEDLQAMHDQLNKLENVVSELFDSHTRLENTTNIRFATTATQMEAGRKETVRAHGRIDKLNRRLDQ